MSIANAGPTTLKIAFGPDGTGVFDPGLPVLGGDAVEALFGEARPAGRKGLFSLFQAGGWRLGAASVRAAPDLGDAVLGLYDGLFDAAGGQSLARVWNYVPAINETGPEDLENYRTFCRARSLAFERRFGEGFEARLPAASAVGASSGELTVVFAAWDAAPRHVENPLQIPAYEYPADYGPRAPSFARATVVPGGEAIFISGTAAVRGHESVAPGNLQGQLDCVLGNLREISAACGLGSRLGEDRFARRHFKVYVRNPMDFAHTAAAFQKGLFAAGDRVTYLRADLCRSALLVEIEASLFRE